MFWVPLNATRLEEEQIRAIFRRQHRETVLTDQPILYFYYFILIYKNLHMYKIFV